MSFPIPSGDRVLLVVPHPDDESLAMGGLIQRLGSSGATARLLMVTNGDNNPWPQRWLEKRWRISPEDQQRWGALRRQEARNALQKLGFQGEARFLHFPDQGITSRLLRADAETVERFCCEIREWNPTRIVIPSAYDLHPDHNGLYVLLQIALDRMGLAHLPQLHFLVHCKRPDLVPCRQDVRLSEHERHVKRQAIHCHGTQMALSSKRFLAYARPEEAYYEPAPVEAAMPNHRIPEAFLQDRALHLTVTLPPRFSMGDALWIAGESPTEGSLRWRLALPGSSRNVRLFDTLANVWGSEAGVKIRGRVAKVEIPLATHQPLSRLFVKFHRKTIFLDDSGWREVPVR